MAIDHEGDYWLFLALATVKFGNFRSRTVAMNGAGRPGYLPPTSKSARDPKI